MWNLPDHSTRASVNEIHIHVKVHVYLPAEVEALVMRFIAYTPSRQLSV